MTLGIDRLPTEAARRSTGLDELVADGDEGRDLGPGHAEPGGGGLVARGDQRGGVVEVEGLEVVVVDLEELLGDDHDAVVGLLVGHGQAADRPGQLGGLGGGGGLDHGQALGRREVGEDAAEVLAQGGDLLLLDLERGGDRVLAGLQEEGAPAGRADGAGQDVGRVGELEGLAHDRPSRERSSPVELAASTAGPVDP